MSGRAELREPWRILFWADAPGFRSGHGSGAFDGVPGDWFTAGTGEDDMFARLLERQYGYRIYHAGYPGGPYDQFVNLAIEVLTLR